MPRERTTQEKHFDEILKTCVKKSEPHQRKSYDNNLYTVTTIAASSWFGGQRTPIICTSYDRATEVVLENEGDIFEASYMLAVIEGIQPNILYGNVIGEQYWYMWEGPYHDGKYVPIEIPEEYKNILGFGIG